MVGVLRDPSVVCWVGHGGGVASQPSVVAPLQAAASVELWTLFLPVGSLWLSRDPFGGDAVASGAVARLEA